MSIKETIDWSLLYVRERCEEHFSCEIDYSIYITISLHTTNNHIYKMIEMTI